MKWNQFVQGDAFELMPEMEDGSVDFLFTSPPDISQTEFEKDIESFKLFQQKFLEQFFEKNKCFSKKSRNGNFTDNISHILNQCFFAHPDTS